jgi:hypothetical protein
MTAYSRRRLLAQGAAALAFAPDLAQAASSTAQPATPPSPSTEAIQTFLDATQRMTLDVMIGGRGPFRFMIDTGADQSVVSAEVVQQLGLTVGDTVVVQGISRAVPAPTVRLQDVRFGYVAIESLSAPVLPRAWLGADGYLGLDVLDGRKVTFDFQHVQIKVDQSDHRADWVNSSDIIVRTNGSNGRLKAVNSSVDGVRAYAFVDSGAEMSIGNTRLFAALQERGGTYLSDVVVPIFGVTGGMSPGRITYVKDIKMDTLHFLRSNLVISDLQVFDVWGLNDRPALFIGMNFLRQTAALTIDYGLKELRFRTASVRVASRA